MATRRVTIKLTKLRCIRESDPGASEPYLWTTYFALGAPIPPFQTGPLAVNTPSYDAFRTEFPDGVSAGSVVSIPPFIASASFDLDLDGIGPKMIGCVAVLMEEDNTRQRDIVFGRIAYSKEIEKQLNALIVKRIQTNDAGPLSDAEKEAIKTAVSSKVITAVGSHQGPFDLNRDQDDALGFTQKVFARDSTDPIVAGSFDFPEIVTTRRFPLTSIQVVTDRYVLSGELTIAAVPPVTIDLCATPRVALEAKRREIQGLQGRRAALQASLSNATPQQRAGIVAQIRETNEELDRNEALLPGLEAALQACIDKFPTPIGVGGVGGVNPGSLGQ